MSKIRDVVITVLAAGVLLAALPGCEKKEGPVERAGKAVDKAVVDTGKKIEEAGEKVQDAARDAKK